MFANVAPDGALFLISASHYLSRRMASSAHSLSFSSSDNCSKALEASSARSARLGAPKPQGKRTWIWLSCPDALLASPSEISVASFNKIVASGYFCLIKLKRSLVRSRE